MKKILTQKTSYPKDSNPEFHKEDPKSAMTAADVLDFYKANAKHGRANLA
jgi:hypothetical protein